MAQQDENAAEIQYRIKQDDLATACLDWSSDLVAGRLGRLLDTRTRQLLQKKGVLDNARQ